MTRYHQLVAETPDPVLNGPYMYVRSPEPLQELSYWTVKVYRGPWLPGPLPAQYPCWQAVEGVVEQY